MKNKDLLVLFEGDDMTGMLDLFSAFVNLKECDNSDYCVQELNLVGHLMSYELNNRKYSMHTLLKIAKFLRENFDIVIVYVSTDTENNIYEQFLVEQGANPESVHKVMQTFKAEQLYWLKLIETASVSDKKFEIIFCPVDKYNNDEDIENAAKNLKIEIEKRMTRN